MKVYFGALAIAAVVLAALPAPAAASAAPPANDDFADAAAIDPTVLQSCIVANSTGGSR